LAANSSAPFAMSVRGKTYTERAEAAPALVDSLRQAYGEGKRRCQVVEATVLVSSFVNASRGVRKPRTARGRSLSSSAMALR